MPLASTMNALGSPGAERLLDILPLHIGSFSVEFESGIEPICRSVEQCISFSAISLEIYARSRFRYRSYSTQNGRNLEYHRYANHLHS